MVGRGKAGVCPLVLLCQFPTLCPLSAAHRVGTESGATTTEKVFNMNSSTQSVVITPIFQDIDDIPEYVSVNGEIYFLLHEEGFNDLQRIFRMLQLVIFALSQKSIVEINAEDVQAALEYPLFNLQAIIGEINSFKFHPLNS